MFIHKKDLKFLMTKHQAISWIGFQWILVITNKIWYLLYLYCDLMQDMTTDFYWIKAWTYFIFMYMISQEIIHYHFEYIKNGLHGNQSEGTVFYMHEHTVYTGVAQWWAYLLCGHHIYSEYILFCKHLSVEIIQMIKKIF